VLLLASSLAFAVGPRCLTPIYLSAGRETATMASPDPYRPEAAGYVDSELYPLRVHYRRESDAERAATLLLPLAEESWRVQIEEMGWPPPPADSGLGGDDRFDYYLTNEDTYGGAWTWGTGSDTDTTDDWFSQASFIALDDRGISDDLMPDFVAHEFNHALQYTIDGWELTLFVWESTAQAMEDLVYDDSDVYMADIPDFQELPFASLLFDGYSDEVMEYDDYSYYEYGGSIWSLFLEQRYGTNDGTTLLHLWDTMAQGGRVAEPDFVDAMGAAFGSGEDDYGSVYAEFAEWRMFVASWDDGAHFEEGAIWPAEAEVALAGTLDLGSIDGREVTTEDTPYDLGGSYWAVNGATPDGGSWLRADLTVEAGARWELIGAAWPDGGGPATVDRATARDAGTVSVWLPVAGVERYMFGAANLAPPGLDPENSTIERRGYTLAFAVTDDGPPDTDPTGGDDTGGGDDSGGDDPLGENPRGDKDAEPSGCGCSAPGASMPLFGWVVALGALLAFRRTHPAPTPR